MPELCCAYHLYVPGRCPPALPTSTSPLSSSWDTLSTTGAGVGGGASRTGLSPPQLVKPLRVDSTAPHPTTRISRCGCAVNDRSNVPAFNRYHQSVLRCAEWVAQVRLAQDDDAGGGLGESSAIVIDFEHDLDHDHTKHHHRRTAACEGFLPPGPSTATTVIAMNNTGHHHRRPEDDDDDHSETETETHDEHVGDRSHVHLVTASPRIPGGSQQPHPTPTALCSCGDPHCLGGPVQLRTPAPRVCACDDPNCPGGRLAFDRSRGGVSTPRD